MYDMIVVGIGGMGSATLAHCAKRGKRVLGIEQYPRGHDLGASAGRSRIIRKAYAEGAGYVPLLQRAYRLWRALEREAETQLLDLCGMLLVGNKEGALLRGAADSARSYGLAARALHGCRACAAGSRPERGVEGRRHVTYDAIIIGAGHNGLTAAAYLSRAGLKTLVLERRDVVGGAAVSETPWPGWTVSTASYVCSLLHPQIIAELELARFGYSAYRKDPSSFTPLLDGRSLLISSDPVATAAEIGAFSQRDVDGYRAYAREADRAGDAVFVSFLDDEPSLARFEPSLRALFAGSVADVAERFVETPVLQAIIASDGITGTNRGPRDPGTGYVMAHHVSGQAMGATGAWGFVRGGMGGISQALKGSALAAGADVRPQSSVSKIAIAADRVSGVVLEDGSEIAAGIVLSNAGPKTTFLALSGGEHFAETFVAKVSAWESNGPALKLNLALGELPQYTARPSNGAGVHHRATIHVAPDIDFMQRAFEDAQRDGAAREPFLECYMQTPTDPSLVPPGKHLLSIFAQYFPYERADGPWTAAKRADAASSIIALLAQYAPNVPNAIEAQQLLAPPDLEERFGLEGGHIFHGELLPGQIFEERFSARTPLRGLYLCGSGTHPGGCVTGAPGKRAANAVLADLRRGPARRQPSSVAR